MISTTLDRTVGECSAIYLLAASAPRLRLRPVTLADGSILANVFARLTSDDFRFRSLDSCRVPNAGELGAMLKFDHRRSKHFRGVTRFNCIESRHNHDAFEVEPSPGFYTSDIQDDPCSLVEEADLA